MKIFSLTITLIFTLLFSNVLSADTLSSKKSAPPWQLKTQNGEVISLQQYQNKPVILHFWATWCPYCKKLQPKLVELQKKYQDTGIEIVSISFNEDEGTLPQDEINSRGYNFITAVNGDAVASLYGVRGTPTTFFINRTGKIIFKSSSSDIDDPRLEFAVKEIIKIH